MCILTLHRDGQDLALSGPCGRNADECGLIRIPGSGDSNSEIRTGGTGQVDINSIAGRESCRFG